jgi:hypothetical protein
MERFNYSGTVMCFTGVTEEVQEGGSQLIQAENSKDFSVFCNFTIHYIERGHAPRAPPHWAHLGRRKGALVAAVDDFMFTWHVLHQEWKRK